MTIKQLEKIGIYRPNPHRLNVFSMMGIDGEFKLYPPYSMEYVIKEIYAMGHKDGEVYGAQEKIRQIKNLLQIETL